VRWDKPTAQYPGLNGFQRYAKSQSWRGPVGTITVSGTGTSRGMKPLGLLFAQTKIRIPCAWGLVNVGTERGFLECKRQRRNSELDAGHLPTCSTEENPTEEYVVPVRRQEHHSQLRLQFSVESHGRRNPDDLLV
jgi:hypothetical protein